MCQCQLIPVTTRPGLPVLQSIAEIRYKIITNVINNECF